MFPSVEKAFRSFTQTFEGCVLYMYLDIKGLVTVGVGNLVDPVELAKALPFRFKNRPGIVAPGTPATPDQIAAEWQKLKANLDLAKAGFAACEALTELELSAADLDALVVARVTNNENFLKRQSPFQAFDTWPADAQLGLLSMAWAMGPGGPGQFPHFCAACQRLDFKTAAAECRMNEAGNPGLVPRNRANFTLFSNAALVVQREASGTLQRSALYYPQLLKDGAGT